MAEFTEEDVGKRVVAQDGTTVGTVARVRDGKAFVREAADLDPEIESQLRWDGTVNQEENPLEGRFVSRVTDDVVRLRV